MTDPLRLFWFLPTARDALEVAPNLSAGVGLIREGAGTALVGDPETVAARLREYQAAGVETVIASGYPHLEEAYKVAELLFPALGIDRKPPIPTSSAATLPKTGWCAPAKRVFSRR